MIAYHTVNGDIDNRLRPFQLHHRKHTSEYYIVCPHGYKSSWVPQDKQLKVICHCPSSFSPHIFIVNPIKK